MIQVVLEELSTLELTDLGVSDWIEITQARVNQFAEATGDNQWIHVDVERAEKEAGGTIAHGYLILSLIPRLGADLLKVTDAKRVVNYGSDRVRFISPVRVGQRVRLRSRITSMEAGPDTVRIHRENAIEIEGGAKPACMAHNISLYIK